MISSPERSPERDAALAAMLPNVPFDGWTFRALCTGLASIGVPPDDARLLFPGGAADLIEAFCDWADRRMEAGAGALVTPEMRLPARVRTVIALRLAQNRPYREAVRRAVSVLALPRHARLAARCLTRTVEAIWHVAGDESADFSWYTKRAILTAIYSSTLLYWLRDAGEDDSATLAFLDRRLADHARLHGLVERMQGMVGRLRPA
jgi:ubiquinone biosynthesis protein COQ9